MGVPQGFGGAPEQRGCPRGALGCRFPPKAIGVLRGAGVPQGYGGAGGVPRVIAQLGMAKPGQEGRGVLIYGGPPQQPPTGGKVALQCPCAPPQTAVPTPALSMGKLRHGALPCLHPTSLPTRTPMAPGGCCSPGGAAAPGGASKRSLVSSGCQGTQWRPPAGDPQGSSLQGGRYPLGAPRCHLLLGGLGHPGGRRVAGGLRAVPSPGEGILGGGWRRVPSDCHFPFTLEEGFATSLPPRAA